MSKPMTRAASVGVAAGALLLTLAGGHLALSEAPSAIFNEKSTPATAVVPAPDPGGLNALVALNQAFTSLAAQVAPTVVSIYTTSLPPARQNLPPGFEDELMRYFGALPFQMPQMRREGLGSGFVINADEGYIVTNAHVVQLAGQNADEIMVKFANEENSKGHPARVIGADAQSDVALLKLTDKIPGLKAVVLGDSAQTKVLELVVAVGNPYGHTHTFFQGVVSALGRSLEGVRSDFIQTSAGINPGNSGGPLLNVHGEVIGINSAMDPRAGNIGFAIPINTAKSVIEQLLHGGRVHRAYLGVHLRDIDEQIASLLQLKENAGALVAEVVPGSPAAKAGLVRSDIITKVNARAVESARDVTKALDQFKPGVLIEIEVLRGPARKTIKVTVGDQAALPPN